MDTPCISHEQKQAYAPNPLQFPELSKEITAMRCYKDQLKKNNISRQNWEELEANRPPLTSNLS